MRSSVAGPGGGVGVFCWVMGGLGAFGDLSQATRTAASPRAASEVRRNNLLGISTSKLDGEAV